MRQDKIVQTSKAKTSRDSYDVMHDERMPDNIVTEPVTKIPPPISEKIANGRQLWPL
jgi:hypothetical protein